MKFHTERLDSGCLLIAEHDGREFAQLIRDEELSNHYDRQWLFWHAALGLKFACLGLFKTAKVISDFSADLERLRRE